MRHICLAERFSAPLALGITGPQSIAVYVTAVILVEKLDIAFVLAIDLIRRRKSKAPALMLHRKIEHVLNAKHVCKDSANRICRIKERMGIRSQMENIIDLPQVLADKRLLNIVLDEYQVVIIRILREPGLKPGFISSQGIDSAVKSVRDVLFEQDVYKEASDHSGCA